MRVFQIRFELSNYQAVLIDGDDQFSSPYFRVMDFQVGRVSDSWNPPPIYVDKPKLKRPDIFHLVGAVGLVLTPRALDHLDRFALWVGELLPLPFRGEMLQLLNVLQVYDCLNLERTVFEGGEATVFEFHAHRLPEAPIFRLPQNRSGQLFCHEGVGEPVWEFKSTVENAGLEGLSFDEVWNDRDGGIERKPRW